MTLLADDFPEVPTEKNVVRYLSKKLCFRRHTTTQMGRNTVAISMIAPLQYLLNTLKVGTLEKVFFSNTPNPKTVC